MSRNHKLTRAAILASIVGGASAGWAAEPAQSGPFPDAVQAFANHASATEARLDTQLQGAEGFLWATTPERRERARKGEVICDPGVGKGEIKIPHGLLHDWVGATFVPNATVRAVLTIMQDYDNHKDLYRPEVVDSQMIERSGDDFKVRLRLAKKKVITVVLETEHEAHYRQMDPLWWVSRSRSTRIAEIENYGQPDQRERPAGQDRGFLWRLNSYWSIRERDGGVYLECEAISLTRSVPAALRWLIDPIVRGLAKDSLVNTLRATQAAVSKSIGTPARLSGL